MNPTGQPGGVKRSKPEHEDALSHRVAEISKFFGQPLLAGLGIAALVFGYIGYREYFRSRGLPSGFADVFYADIQLVKLSSKIEGGKVPWTLNVARLLAPAVTGFAAWRSIAAMYRDRFDKVRLQNWRGHVVIGGDQEQSRAVTRAMRGRGRKVVVVDQDLDDKRVASLRSLGVLSVIGDSRRGDVLSTARVGRADAIVAMSDNDAANLEAALRALPLAERANRPLRAVAHIAGVDLCELLRIDSLNDAGNVRSIDYLNGLELAARDIERAAEAALGLRLHEAPRTILISGPAPVVGHLLARLARRTPTPEAGTGESRPPGARPPAVWLVGADANAALAEASRRVHDIGGRLDVTVHAVTIESVMGTAPLDGPSWVDLSAAIIIGKGVETLGVALAIAERLEHDSAAVAALPNAAPLVPLVRGARPGRAKLVVVDTVQWASDVDLVLGGTVEVLARATHDNYVAARRAGLNAAEALVDDPSLLPWAELREHLRNSNRSQARHVSVKLAAIGCALAPLTGRREPFAFSREEIERLGALEHERWAAERRADGWSDGPRDPVRKRTPFLVPWAELSEDAKELDRITVRDLPGFLLDVGYEIVRTTG